MSVVLLIDVVSGFLDSLRAAKKAPYTVSTYQRDLKAVAELRVDTRGTAGGLSLT